MWLATVGVTWSKYDARASKESTMVATSDARGTSIISLMAVEEKCGVLAYSSVYGAIFVLSCGEQLYANVILGTSMSHEVALLVSSHTLRSARLIVPTLRSTRPLP